MNHGSDRFEKIEKLGEGTYGIVYKARDRTNGNVCLLASLSFRSLRLRRSVLSIKMKACPLLQYAKFLCSKRSTTPTSSSSSMSSTPLRNYISSSSIWTTTLKSS